MILSFRPPWFLKTPLRFVATSFLTITPFLLWWAAFWFVGFKFDIDCGQHLKRAADANTLEVAEQELAVVISYAEKHGMTEGYTTVLKPLWLRPVDDVGFWYRNVKAAHDELAKAIRDGVSQDQKSVILLKLRQTLLDHKQSGEDVTIPPGLSRFPHNVAWCLAGWVLGVIALPMSLLLFCFCCAGGRTP